MLPLAKKYGAMFVLLPLSDEGLPKDAKEKHEIIDTVYDRAMELGMAHEDIVVDGLVATIGANPEAAKECYDTISYCKDIRKLPTICGLSNISFGLPERSFVNTAFLTMAICRGLTMAIANPSQELLMNAAFASDDDPSEKLPNRHEHYGKWSCWRRIANDCDLTAGIHCNCDETGAKAQKTGYGATGCRLQFDKHVYSTRTMNYGYYLSPSFMPMVLLQSSRSWRQFSSSEPNSTARPGNDGARGRRLGLRGLRGKILPITVIMFLMSELMLLGVLE